MSKAVGLQNNTFYYGCVCDRNDPLKLGRVKVRVVGVHSENTSAVPLEDLPWAPIILPPTNGFSGIGISPTGIIEGTWVLVYFADGINLQNPVVIGVTTGINPSTKLIDSKPVAEAKSEANAVAPSQKPKTVNEKGTTTGKELGWVSEKYEVGNRGPGYVSSGKGDLGGRSYGCFQLASTTGTLAQYLKVSEFKSNFAGMAVNSNEFVSCWKNLGDTKKAEFKEDQRVFIEKTHFVPAVNKVQFIDPNNRGEAIQEMIWSTAVQYGPGKVGTILKRALNGKNVSDLTDADIVVLVQDNKRDNVPTDFKSSPSLHPGLKSRCDSEKKDLLALCSEKPSPDLKKAAPLPKDDYGQPIESAAKITTTPSYTPKKGSGGFADPNGRFPKTGYLGKPDTNRLARAEEINKTIHKLKKLSTVNANGFREPYTFGAKYPFNKVMETESGHVIEIDDTKDAERIHIYHRSGSFIEFHPDGTIVKKSVNDDNEVVISNKSVYVFGSCNMFVEGDVKVQSLGNMSLESEANVSVRAQGNMNLECGGKFNVLAGGGGEFAFGGDLNMFAPMITQNNASKSVSVKVDVGAKFELQKQVAEEEEPAKSDDWDTDNSGKNQTFASTRELDEAVGYKTESAPPVAPMDIQVAPATTSTPNTASVEGVEKFKPSFKLSTNYNLADLTTCCAAFKYELQAQCGLSEADIVKNLMGVAEGILEPIRSHFGGSAFIISNCFRQYKGSGKSQHFSGMAVDLQFPGNADRIPHIAEEIRKLLPTWDQLIVEYHANNPVIHISFDAAKNRKMVFSTYSTNFSGLRPYGIYDSGKNLIYSV